jgi:hypothetical protein
MVRAERGTRTLTPLLKAARYAEDPLTPGFLIIGYLSNFRSAPIISTVLPAGGPVYDSCRLIKTKAESSPRRLAERLAQGFH